MNRQHNISIVIDGVQIGAWETYDITVDMLSPADHCRLRMPFERSVWDLVREDRPVRVQIDDVPILTGFIDERLVPENDESVEVLARCRAGRLVDESAPGINYAGLDLHALIQSAAEPWFTSVAFNNARNRRVIRGRGRKARAAGEPIVLKGNKKIGTHIEPGQTRWQVIQTVCKQAGVLAWSAGDGAELVVGKPHYAQEPQWRFFMPAARSQRDDESTVLGMGVRFSTAECYSRVIVVGSGRGSPSNYGPSVAARYGEAKDNPSTPDGDGRRFTAPKRLIVTRTVASLGEARELAAREMAVRDAHAHAITVVAPGHGQTDQSGEVTIFAPDTIADVEDERTGTAGRYLVTSCSFRSDRQAGETTSMQLVRVGAELTT